MELPSSKRKRVSAPLADAQAIKRQRLAQPALKIVYVCLSSKEAHCSKPKLKAKRRMKINIC